MRLFSVSMSANVFTLQSKGFLSRNTVNYTEFLTAFAKTIFSRELKYSRSLRYASYSVLKNICQKLENKKTSIHFNVRVVHVFFKNDPFLIK